MNKKTKNNNTENIGKELYRFQTPECVDRERGKTWFIGLGVFVLLGVFWGIFENSLSIILLSILLGGIYTMVYNKKSDIITVLFTEIGMKWKERFFTYQEIAAFWIIWQPEDDVFTLHVILSEGFQKEIVVPIKNQDPGKIRDILGYYVPEIEGKTERFTDVLTRTLKL